MSDDLRKKVEEFNNRVMEENAKAAELSLSTEELGRWNDVSRRMFVPFHGDGIISQF